MKYKGLLVILSTLLLSSCSLVDPNRNLFDKDTSSGSSSLPSVNSEPIEDSSSSSSQAGSNNDDHQEVVDETKKYQMKDPDFTTPKRNNINEVTQEDLFNLGNKVDIKVKMNDEQLRLLEQDFSSYSKSEIYRVADQVDITLQNYDQTFSWSFPYVGIRQKGNTSRTPIFMGDTLNPFNHYKLSFDENFDDPELYSPSFIDEMRQKRNNVDFSKRDILGCSGLDFKWNKNEDMTRIKEIYASKMYKAGGIISQHIGLSTFSIIETSKANQETSFGLCTLYEPASKGMIKDALRSGYDYLNMGTWDEELLGTNALPNTKYGDYYKCSYGVGEGLSSLGADLSFASIQGKRIGLGDTFGNLVPAYERKTNKKIPYDETRLKNLVNVINTKSYEEIKKVIDIDEFLKEEAISFFVGNPDSIRYNYNNYLMYFRRIDGKAIILPYDVDRCFGIIKDWNLFNGVTKVKPLGRENAQGEQRNALFNKTILGSKEAQDIYMKMIEEIKNSPWVLDASFENFFNKAKDTYSGHDFSLTDSNISFSNYMKSKLDVLNNKDEGGQPDNPDIGEVEDTKEYDNIYIVGDFNDCAWGQYNPNDLDKYKLTKLSKYEHEYTITVEKFNEDHIVKFKFNNGLNNYDQIDWCLSNDGLTLIKEGRGRHLYITGLEIGDQIKIKINTNTLESSIEIIKNEGNENQGPDINGEDKLSPYYLVGNFNSWNSYSSSDPTKYNFRQIDEYNYTIEVKIEVDLDNGLMIFKINGGPDGYATIDWTISNNLTQIDQEHRENSVLENVAFGDVVRVEMNVSTLEASVTLVKGNN